MRSTEIPLPREARRPAGALANEVGRAVKGRRDQVVPATKFGGTSSTGRGGQLDSSRIAVTPGMRRRQGRVA
ncbi:hypothetical protein GCM10018965_058610 [Nonomuraea roseola]